MRPFTDIEKANNNFFGNLVGVDMQLDELKVYLNEVHNFIRITNVHLHTDKVKGLAGQELDVVAVTIPADGVPEQGAIDVITTVPFPKGSGFGI